MTRYHSWPVTILKDLEWIQLKPVLTDLVATMEEIIMVENCPYQLWDLAVIKFTQEDFTLVFID